MLVIDTRETKPGGHGIFEELKRFDVPVAEMQMEYGDCVFDGQGQDEHGKPCHVTVGIERKRLGLERGRLSTDLITSMTDRRLSGKQLAGMALSYNFVYLFIEGMWRATTTGEIEVSEDGKWWKPLYANGGHSNRRISHRQVMSYLTTLELKGATATGNRFAIRRTLNMKETAGQYVDLWHWFQKPWHEHTSHQQMYAPSPEMQTGTKVSFSDPLEVFRREYGEQAVICWKTAAQLPGIDSVRAKDLAIHFRTAERMFSAGPGEWQRVRGIGPRTAETAAKLIREARNVVK